MAFHGPSETCPLQQNEVASYGTAWGRNKISSSGAELPGHPTASSELFEGRSLHKIWSSQIALEGLGGLWWSWLNALQWLFFDLLGPIVISYWLKTSVSAQSQNPYYAYQKVNSVKDTLILSWYNLHGQFTISFFFIQYLLYWPNVQWNLHVFPLTPWTLDHSPKA